MNIQSFQSLDEMVAGIKADCEAQLKAMSDKLLAAEIEATMAKDQLKVAREAQMAAERVTTKLLTQFGTVAQVFEEAKNLALSLRGTEPTADKLPEVAPTLEAPHANP